MSRSTRSTSDPVLPPATLGVFGGGQLGRYFVMAARTMGYRTMVLEPDPLSPAGAVADEHIVAPYDDVDALARMAAQCAVVTTEFENAPAAAMESMARETLVRPAARAIEISQDRRSEKRFLESIGIVVARYVVIETEADLDDPEVTFPAILKMARLGYDGLGQVSVPEPADLAAAWHELGRPACVLEQRLTFEREVSVVLARGFDGSQAAYPVTANKHVRGILDVSTAPDNGAGSAGAVEVAGRIAAALDYVGVLAVEFFVVDGRLLVNEIAPRPHNSGHWTLDAARTSQFEQQVRAICGLTLGDTAMSAPAVAMANILGDRLIPDAPDWAAVLADRNVHLHLYGKHEPRPGRKMGHLTVVADTVDDARERVMSRRHGNRQTADR